MSGKVLIGRSMDEIPTPALVLDIEGFTKNIEAMGRYLAGSKVKVRPHVKTHKTPAIGHLQMKAGAIGLCCATVGEAEVMVYSGLDNILIANELVDAQSIKRAVCLARQARIICIADDLENIAQLSAAAGQYGVKIDVLPDLDVGQGRCGARSIEKLVELAKAVDKAPNLNFKGVFGYEGHVQFIPDRAERTQKGQACNRMLVDAAKAVAGLGMNVEIVTGAGTGTYDIAGEFPGMTEIQAGSYIFMDGTYGKLGLPFEQSLTVLSTVVSRPAEDIAIFDVGLKGISPERFNPSVRGCGDQLAIKNLSEEHATGQMLQGCLELRPGNRVHFVPSHCCSTVNLYDEMYVVRAGVVEAIWPIAARRA